MKATKAGLTIRSERLDLGPFPCHLRNFRDSETKDAPQIYRLGGTLQIGNDSLPWIMNESLYLERPSRIERIPKQGQGSRAMSECLNSMFERRKCVNFFTGQ
jgi:hypothetical protein